MKKLLDISSEERNRILEMHQSATKRNYLSEEAPQPAQTGQILAGAETAKDVDDIKNTLSGPARLNGANLQTILNELRAGSKVGLLQGKERFYYWTASVSGNNYQFMILELLPSGKIRIVVEFKYDTKAKVWFDLIYDRDNQLRDSASQQKHILNDPQLKQNAVTFFWKSLIDSVSFNNMNTGYVTRLISYNKQFNQPNNLVSMLKLKGNLKPEPNSGITQQTVDSIKSSPIYTSVS
jgi:hypothetical protein